MLLYLDLISPTAIADTASTDQAKPVIINILANFTSKIRRWVLVLDAIATSDHKLSTPKAATRIRQAMSTTGYAANHLFEMFEHLQQDWQLGKK